MNVAKALRLQAGDVVAFVGAGGKTSCLRRIVNELSPKMLVAATTTTKLAQTDTSLADNHYIIHEPYLLADALSKQNNTGSALFTGPKAEQEGKWTSLAKDDLRSLIEFIQMRGGILLVEADDARGARLKAPAEFEPVIPAEATVVVPMLRTDVLGHRNKAGRVHRPERLAALLHLSDDEPLTIEHLARFLRHREGGLKAIPEGAIVRVFLNAVESAELEAQAKDLARILLEEEQIASVVLASLDDPDPVREVWARIGIVLLAAGGSQRFGTPKLLESWRGKPILRHVAEMIIASEMKPVVVVLGSDSEQLRATIADLDLPILENAAWLEGQSTSLKIGLREIQEACEAVIFVLGDMPEVGTEILTQLVSTHHKTLHSIIAPYAGQRWGNPVLFDRRTFDELLALKGDQGGRALFERYPPFPVQATKGELFDVDTPEDLSHQE
jgi:molybdenum cofactor cytidylyltransferase